jgi:prophage regulatory protein
MAIVGLQKSSIYEGVKNGTFPAPIKLSRRAVCWPESHIAAWVDERIHHAYKFEV